MMSGLWVLEVTACASSSNERHFTMRHVSGLEALPHNPRNGS